MALAVRGKLPKNSLFHVGSVHSTSRVPLETAKLEATPPTTLCARGCGVYSQGGAQKTRPLSAASDRRSNDAMQQNKQPRLSLELAIKAQWNSITSKWPHQLNLRQAPNVYGDHNVR